MRTALVAPLLATALAACSSVSVDADWDRQADFGAWRAWAWVATDDRLDTPFDRRVEAAIADALAAKGFREARGEEPDFLVAHHASRRREVSVWDDPDPFWPHRRWAWRRGWGGPRIYEYEVGTLVVDLIDRRGGFIAWRGSAERVLGDDAPTPAERDARVREAVSKMLAQFPPR